MLNVAEFDLPYSFFSDAISASLAPQYNMEKSLEDLYAKHRGKKADKWQSYLRVYDKLLHIYRNRNIDLLEIGIQNGGSLEIWSQFFRSAEHLIGCDINPDCGTLHFEDERIDVVIGDASKKCTQEAILSKCDKFDIIIDDGSHTSADIIVTFSGLFPHLRDGGLYIVEDIHCSYWTEFGGGLYNQLSAISFMKRLSDIVNFEHWGVNLTRRDLLEPLKNFYRFDLDESDLGHIYSVDFTNSMVVIQKESSEYNTLGKRIITGKNADVAHQINTYGEDQSELIPQTLEGLVDPINYALELEERKAKIDSLSQHLRAKDEIIQHLLNSTSWKVTRPLRALKNFLQPPGTSQQ